MTTTARPRTELPSSTEPKKMSLADAIAVTTEAVPREISAESAVLGSMIIDPDVIGGVLMILKKSDAFFDPANRLVFTILRRMFDENTPIDAMTLHRKLAGEKILAEVGDIHKISELAHSVPTSAHAEYYAAMVYESWMKRKLISAATIITRDAYESPENSKILIDRAEEKIFDLSQSQQTNDVAVKIGDVNYEAIEALMARQEGVISGLPTGYVDIDTITAGFQDGEMIILAARPSVGKTALAMSVLSHAALKGTSVGFLSMEMNRTAISQRLCTCHAMVDSQKLRRGYMNQTEKDKLGAAVSELNGIPFYIDDTASLTIMDARTRIRRMVRDYGIKLAAIDYIQLMQAGKKAENRQQEVTQISSGIKALARELNIPILVLSQLNRASESENRAPRSSDLRESGSLEQDADVVMLLHREVVQHRGDDLWMQSNSHRLNEASLIISKQRNGATGVVKLTFLEYCTRFVNYNPGI